ncbi:MAG: hypothetical protein FJ295_17840 [Planctomycetes bacterium]|nr:hypothetical protein [Planctomycetota bacterium]
MKLRAFLFGLGVIAVTGCQTAAPFANAKTGSGLGESAARFHDSGDVRPAFSYSQRASEVERNLNVR